MMTQKNWNSDKPIHKSDISIEEINRVLEVGHLLLSVLSDEEIEKLQIILNGEIAEVEIGNAGVA